MVKKNMFKKLICLIATMALIVSTVACGGADNSDKVDASFLGTIMSVSREEGSGTGAEFGNLINSDGTKATDSAQSTELLIEMVLDNENAIGYAAYSEVSAAQLISSDLDKNQLSILSVEGVSPNMETIENDDYPLCRNYQLAYSGHLSAAQADFLAYVMSAGQKIISENCFPVREASSFLSDRSSGKIVISGSSSMETIIKNLVADYKTYNSKVTFDIQITDSSKGLTSAIQGDCDFAMSSRSLEDYESELLNSKVIGRDAIAVIVNKNNPITDISLKELKKIYDGEYTEWADL